MYPWGRVARVHENGRINYEGMETRADGSDVDGEAAVAAEEAVGAAEDAVARAEAVLKKAKSVKTREAAQAALDEAEAQLETALQSVLDVEFGGEGDNSKGDGLAQDDDDDDDDDDEEEEAEEKDNDALERRPDNFSRVDTMLPVSELRTKFPRFLEAMPRFVDVKVGEMLYLPCGWYHDVQSWSTPNCPHMAMNYVRRRSKNIPIHPISFRLCSFIVVSSA